MRSTFILLGLVGLLCQGCMTTALDESTSTEEDVTWSNARVADVAVDKTGTLHIVIEGDDGELYVFGAHKDKLADGLERCRLDLDGGRIPDDARCEDYRVPRVTIEKDEDGKSQLVLARPTAAPPAAPTWRRRPARAAPAAGSPSRCSVR